MTHAADPGRARGALHAAAACVVDERGAHRRAATCYAIGEVAVHRPARRQPARLELAARGAGLRARAPPTTSRDAERDAPAPQRRRPGTRARPARSRRGGRRHATTGTRSAASCGTTSASCAPTSASSARARRIELLREEIRDYYWNFARHPRPARAAQHRRGRAADHRVRAPPQGEPRPALHPRPPRARPAPGARHHRRAAATGRSSRPSGGGAPRCLTRR